MTTRRGHDSVIRPRFFDEIVIVPRYNAEVNKTDNYSHTALFEALKGNHYDLARYLYKHGGKVKIGQKMLASRLCYMVKRNELDKLQVICSKR